MFCPNIFCSLWHGFRSATSQHVPRVSGSKVSGTLAHCPQESLSALMPSPSPLYLVRMQLHSVVDCLARLIGTLGSTEMSLPFLFCLCTEGKIIKLPFFCDTRFGVPSMYHSRGSLSLTEKITTHILSQPIMADVVFLPGRQTSVSASVFELFL